MLARRVVFGCLCACGNGSGPAPASGSAGLVQPGDLAITDVTVVPMSRAGELPHQTVIVRGERIVAIAPSAAINVAGARTIDGAGKWLMPGLADMHVHLWRDADLAMYVASGVTMIRNMWGVPQHLVWRRELERGERFGPTIVTAGPMIDGKPPAWAGSVVLERADAAEALVVAQQKAGYDFIKVVNLLSRDAYDAVAAAAARHGLALAGHVPYAAGLDGVLAAKQHSIEHLDGYMPALVPEPAKLPPFDDQDAWIRAVVARADLARIPGIVERTKTAGAWNCPTLIGNDRIPELYDLAAITKRVAWLDLVPAAQRARWDRDFDAHHGTADELKVNRDVNVLFAKVAAALANGGAPILVGTDTGGPYVVAGEALHDEIELLVAAGIPRPLVMRAATADAWRYLGHPHDGVVEVGARADLVLVAADPLTTALPLVPEGVVLRGRWQSRVDLEARLAEVRAHTGPPADPWFDLPALDRAKQFEIAVRATPVGSERVAIEPTTLVAQLVDFGEGLDATTSIDAHDNVAITAHKRGLALELHGQRRATEFVLTGHDLGGNAIEVKAALPATTIVTPAGITGAIRLGARAAAGARTIDALEVDYEAGPSLVAHHYAVRRSSRDGSRVVTLVDGEQTIELVVDAAGAVTAMTRDGQTWH